MKVAINILLVLLIPLYSFCGVIDDCQFDFITGEPNDQYFNIWFNGHGFGLFDELVSVDGSAIICEKHDGAFSSPGVWTCIPNHVDITLDIKPIPLSSAVTVMFTSFFCDGYAVDVFVNGIAEWDQSLGLYKNITQDQLGIKTTIIQSGMNGIFILISFDGNAGVDSYKYLFKVKNNIQCNGYQIEIR